MPRDNPDWADQLTTAIAAVDRPGDFCTSGTAAATLPGLDVPGVGPVGLPLSAGQAGSLKQHCEQAAYGKGTRTVVDTDVRRVWRLTPDRFTLANPAWPAAVDQMVAAVQQSLGLEDRALSAHLYDLLLYEPGGFFLPHRDGEKLDRMVATLVVMLPSHYTGGELVVRHERQERVIDLGGDSSRFQTQYAAFYADCEHEVKPVTAGHRLCLVYNLTLAAKGKRSPVGAPRRDDHVRRVADLLARWPAAAAPDKLAVTLEHQYTKDGLTWDALKGIDRTRADVLAAAAAGANCHAYLALVTLWQVGAAEGDEYDDYYGRGYDEEGDDEGDDDDTQGEYEMGDLIDTAVTADGWRAPDGTAMPFATLPIGEGEVWPKESLQAVKPEEEFEGYTGNAGMTLERWYRRAAIVLWPDARHFDVLCAAGAKQAVPALAQMADPLRHAGGEPAAKLRDRCRRFARKILHGWPGDIDRPWGRPEPSTVDPLPSLDVVDDVPLFRTYLSDTLRKDTALLPGPGLAGILSRHGWATFRPSLTALFDRTTTGSLGRNVHLLDRLCRAAARLGHKSDRAAALTVCRRLARRAVDATVAVDRERSHQSPAAHVRLARLARSLLLVRSDALLSRLVDHLIATPDRYPLQAVQMSSLTLLGRWLDKHPKRWRSPALGRWIADVRRRLEALTAAVPQPPADQRRDAAITCTCADCTELNRFLADPAERQHSFKMAQPRRDHLENQIRAFGCDLDRKTDRKPRPQILICTKNDATYRRLLREYHENLEHLAKVKSFPTPT